ncbi:hypothetical protein BCR39DRAFT_509125 [Naematelia encephala]|uniref:WIBG Mago-binding domain-containing protein n=1 Tax=Naematelia encephala TaxID=71784 RepID=A0A1Y2BKT4_9TREE|nr:hypothetical protein BCR39DRAFT_509125 [Naematelia encephala]
MSLPPLNPDKTTSGIIVDPSTLERVVPSSKRADGSVRKQLKIRPGFTPQEDVGVFRPTRQRAAESSKGIVPGSNRPAPKPQPNPDNPFAAPPPSAKSKAQMKNERRRAKKREDKAWDEDSDDDDEDGGDIKAAFAQVDAERERASGAGEILDDQNLAKGGLHVNGEEGEEGGGAPIGTGVVENGIGIGADHEVQETTEILSPPPPGPGDVPDSASTTKLASSIPSSTPIQGTSDASPSVTVNETSRPVSKADGPWRTVQSQSPLTTNPPPVASTASRQSKPHPIQGGRKGPIGLAHPPPVSSSSSLPKSTKKSSTPKIKTQTPPASAPEPRVRKEIRVRQGGANDLTSLASRLKNIVLENQKTGSRDRRKEASTTTSSAETA